MSRKKQDATAPGKDAGESRLRRDKTPVLPRGSNHSATVRKGSTSRNAAKMKNAKNVPPTLGDIDLHLFGEGKHERIYEKLGAHCRTHEGKHGVSFAVWAPAADRVSVVGEFNDWNAAKHAMRQQGSSGIWELFVTGLRGGELYKYAITFAGKEFFKADPYASMMEVPPNTSSIVSQSRRS